MTAKTKPADAGKKIRVTLVKGITATKHKHRESVKGLGLSIAATRWKSRTRRRSAE